ncbi:MAG: hypothetical protein K0S32_3917 [Bacteroidetes bacterium]|jgi:predicted ABC-type ATPase|nr:hypothetical protein [Bacteroidota bacterium]
MHWPEIFRKEDYEIVMIYFCLDSVNEAKKRVQIRFQNGGHFVPDHEVEERFYLGYQNLNEYINDFDRIYLLDSSTYNEAPRFITSIINGKIETLNNYPEFMKLLVPSATRLVEQFSKLD